jgi:threonine-phosphate decarboxylase
MTDIFDHGGNIFSVARSLGVSPEDILDFSASINPLGFADGVKQRVSAAFDSVMHYPDSDATELKKALSLFHGVNDTQIIVANGSTELIYLLPRLIGGKRGLVVAPAFSEYAKALISAGMEVHYLKLDPEDGFHFSADMLEKSLSEGYDMMFLCNPGNPAGNLISRSVIREALDLCRAAGTFLVLDEAFMDFSEPDSAKSIVVNDGNGIVLRSMTKFYAIPGLRVGYALGSSGLVGTLRSLRGPWSVNTLAQIAAVASLSDESHVRRTSTFVENERTYLTDELARIGALKIYPSTANYLLIKIEKNISAGKLRLELMKRFILIRDCSNFEGLNGEFFRIAVRKREENEKLLDSLREIFVRQ